MTGLSPLARDGFLLQPRLIGSELHVQFTGSADDEAQPLLPGYFRLLHAEAVRAGITAVLLDVHELYFINSSCFKALVTWVDLANDTHPAQRYLIKFFVDPKLRWQARSFDALQRMSMGQVSVEPWSRSDP